MAICAALLCTALATPAVAEEVRRAVPRTPSKNLHAIDVGGELARCVALDPMSVVEVEGLAMLRAQLTLSQPLSQCGCASGRVRYEVYERCGDTPFCEMRATSSVEAPTPREQQVVQLGLASGGWIERPALRLQCWVEEVLPAQDVLRPTPARTLSAEDEIMARKNSSAIDAARWMNPQASARAREAGLADLRIKRSRVASCVEVAVGSVESADNLTTLELEVARLRSACPCMGDWLSYSVYERAAGRATAEAASEGMIETSWGVFPLPEESRQQRRVRIILSADNRRHYEPLLVELGCP